MATKRDELAEYERERDKRRTPEHAVARGHGKFWLDGHKLVGGRIGKGKKPRWILVSPE